MKVTEESEKVGLKLNIKKTKIMASGPDRWGDCSHEIKRCLLLGRKVMINLDSILQSRDIKMQGSSSQRSFWSRLWFFQWSCMDVRAGL